MATTAAAMKKMFHTTAHGLSVAQLATAANGVQAEEAMMSIDKRFNTRPTQAWRPA